MKKKYACISLVSITKAISIALFIVLPSLVAAQQKPSIQTGVTFQWVESNQQNGNNPATLASITIDGALYNTFVVPSSYEMTRLGPDGAGWNELWENGSQISLVDGSNDPTWNAESLAAFQDLNLNHYFVSGRNGKDICLDFIAEDTTDAQSQTIFYNSAIPANEGGILAITEREANNCYHIAIFGTPLGGGPEQFLGETFVRPNATKVTGAYYPPNQEPNPGTDYWKADRTVEANKGIGIALFYLSDIVPVGSRITKIEYNASTRDHGDGKFLILQQYAVDQQQTQCENETYSGDLSIYNNAPANSTYQLISAPTVTGIDFEFNTDGTYSYTPPLNFNGDITFDYRLCLPAPNQTVCDNAQVTMTIVALPQNPTFTLSCGTTLSTYTITVDSPLGAEYEYSIDNSGTFQSSPTFNDVPEGTYNLVVRDIYTNCFSDYLDNPIVINLDFNIDVPPTIEIEGCSTSDITSANAVFPYSDTQSGDVKSTFVSNPNYNVNHDFDIQSITYIDTINSTDSCSTEVTRTFTVTDICGHTASANQIISVEDTEAPTLDANALDLTIECGANNTSILNDWLNNNANAFAYDTCGVTWTNNFTGLSDECGETGSATVTFTATDSCGQSVSTTATFTIEDTTGPTINNFPSDTHNDNASCVNTPVLSFINPIEEIGDGNNSTYLQGEVFRFSDVSLNVDALVTIVNMVNAGVPVLDENTGTAPEAFKPRTTYNLANVGDRAYVEYRIDFVDANTSNPTILPEFYTNFNDIDGNTNYGEVNWTEFSNSYTVDDPTDLTITEEGPWIVATAGTTEYDGVTNVNPQSNISTRNTNASSYSFRVGVVARTANVSELVFGRQHSLEFSCIGNYVNPTTTTDEITVECNDLQPAETLTATDSCSNATVTFQETRTDGDCANDYTLERTWTATDECGNETIRTLVINVEDSTNPTFTAPADISIECDEDETDLSIVGDVTNESDGCSPSSASINFEATYTDVITAGTCTNSYTITRTWTLVDECDNTATDSQIITVTDSTDPYFNESSLPTDITVVAGSIPTATTLTASDDCDTSVDVIFTETENGSYCDPSHTIVRTWFAEDDCSNSITHTQTITVNHPVLSASVDTITNVDCFGDATGDISIIVTGGQTPYSYLWSDSSTNQNLTNVTAGTYTLTVTDANNCTTSITETINEPSSALNVSVDVVNATAIGACNNGSATASASGGTSAYDYQWGASTGNQTGPTATNLPVGSHTVVVTDAKNCTTSQTIDIQCTDDCDTAITTGTVTNVLCFGDATGAASVSASSVINPSATYTFTWSNGQVDAGVTSSTISNVIADNYSVSVTLDGSVCSAAVQNITISEPSEALTATITAQTNTSCGSSDASATVEATGGTAPYTYLWNDPSSQNTATATNLSANNYSVIITDANNCEFTLPVTIGNACIAVVKAASSTTSGCVSAGDDVTYTFTVTNTGDVSINSITITDDLLGGDITTTLALTGDDGNNILDPTETWIFTAPDYTVTQADVDAGNITNNVTASGLEPDATTPVTATDTYIIDENNPDVTLCDAAGIAVVKAASSATSSCVSAGDDVTYTFTVTNTGDVSINSITIIDDLLGGDITATLTLAGDDGDTILDPTETWVFTAPDYTVTQADVDAGNITNNVTAAGLEPDGTTPVTATDTYIIDENNPDVTLCDAGGIAIVKAASTPGTDCVEEGDLVTYTFTVTNTGDVSINSITINDDLLGGDITATLTLSGDDGDTILDPTETWVFTAPDYTVTQADVDAGNITNNVTASGLEPDATTMVQATDTYIIDASNPDVTLCSDSGIVVFKSATTPNAGCVAAGDLVTYTFRVENNGQVSVNSITITDDLLGGDITSTLTLTGDANGNSQLDPTESWIFTAPDYTVTQADVDAGNITNNVTAAGLEPDGTTPVTATDTYIIDENNPDVTLCDAGGINVVKAASTPGTDCVEEGDLITYTFTVTNTGDVSINSITITDDLLGGDITSTLTLTGDDGDTILDPTETWIFTAPDYTVTQADVDAGNITNNVTASGLEPDATTMVQATDTYVIDASNPDVTLCSDSGIVVFKSATTPNTGCVTAGDLVTYTFRVENNGQVSVNSITITDDLLGGDITSTLTLTGDANNNSLLDPTESWIFTAPDYTVTQADVDAGNITNNVTAAGLEPDGTTPVTATDTYIIDENNPDVTLCDAGGIAVVKAASTPGTDCVEEGDLVTYTFTVTNTGDVSINSITITDDMLGGDITSTLTLTGDDGDTILDPTETWIFTAPDYTVTQADVDAGNITNNVTASGLEPDATTMVQATDTYVIDASNPDVTLCSDSGIVVFKSATTPNTGCVAAGDLVTYTFRVENNGQVSVNTITITDDLLGGDITSTLTLTGDANNNSLLDPTESWIFTAPDYTVTQADVDAGNITNNVTAAGLEPDGTTPVTATDTYIIDENNPDVTLCDAGGIAIVKAASTPGTDCVEEGDLVTYTFTVTNTGDVSINSITITDDLLGGDITATLTLTGDTNNNSLLDPTESWIFTAPNYTVTQADVDAGNITNNVTAAGLEPDGTTPVTATDTYIIDENNPDVTLCDASGIAVVKAASTPGTECVEEGDLITYTFTVTNTGDVSINSITITDDLLGGDITSTLTLTGDDGDTILDPTETWVFTAPDYTVTQADVDAGNITNNVTASGLEPDATTAVQATDTYIIDASNPDVTLCSDSGIVVFKSATTPNAGCVAAGDLVTYTFRVENNGQVSVNSITITDDLLGGDITATLTLTGDANGNAQLDPTESWIFTAPNYTVTQADVDAGNITNNVTAAGLEPDGTTPVTATDTYIIDENNPDVTLCDAGGINVVKAASTPGTDCVEEGDLITYTFTVTNTGDVSINTVTITDDLLGGDITSTLTLTGDDGDTILDPTETWVFTAPNYTVTQADVDAGNITNNVTAAGLEPDATTMVQATDTYVIDASNPDVTLCSDSGIVVFKSATTPNTGCVAAGDLVTYTFRVENNGQVSVNSITITDDLLGGDITSTLTLTGDTNNNSLLDPSETWIFTAPDYTVTQADVDASNITNNVTAAGLEPDGTTPVTATDTYIIDENNPDVTLCDAGGIAVVKAASTLGTDCVEEGDLVTYTFTVTNTGDVSINTVTITDDLLGGDITSTLTLTGDDGDTILDPTETWVFTAPDYTVTQADVDAGNITNNVTAAGLEPDGTTTVTATDTYIIDANNPDVTLCSESGINLIKTGIFNNENGNECTEIDETITYTFTVSNSGDVALQNIIITDPLLDNAVPQATINFVSGDTDGDSQLDPNETWIYTATYLVTQIDIDATEVVNTATVNATEVLNGTIVTATSQTITELIEDTTPPDTSSCAVLDAAIECSGVDNETIANDWNAANILALENCATDACDNNFAVTSNYNFGNLVSTCGLGGTIAVTYTLTDGTGNASTFTATLTLEDTTPPVFTVPADITVECDVDVSDLTLTGDVTIETDDCSSELQGTYADTLADGTCPTVSIITRTWSVTDDCGNTTNLVQIITVQDTMAPTFIETLPIDLDIECDSVPDPEVLTANDNCGDATVTFVENMTEGACIGDYILERTWTATDSCGNDTVHTQIITVQDSTAPTLVTTSFDENITIACDDIPEVPDLVFEDACSNDITVNFEEISTQVNDVDDYNITRTWTVADSCSNEAVFTQTITVEISNVITALDGRRCIEDVEFDLFDLLSGDFSMDGTWSVVSGIATIDGSMFDPASVELGDYRFKYAITEGPCPTEVEVNLTVDDSCVVLPCGEEDVVISKTVTVNGDGINDFFTLTGVEGCGFVIELQIFNRWGAEIFKSNNYQNNWNGDAHGNSVGSSGKVPTGTYYYIINLRNSGLAPIAGPIYVATN